MKTIFIAFAEYIKNEVSTMSNDKYFILDCIKYNFGFFDSLDECTKCTWNNKLVIDVGTIKELEVDCLAINIEETVYMYQIKRMEDLLKKLDK